MSEAEVITLMESSTSHKEWRANADKVKAAHNGLYPSFWFGAIITSGLCDRVLGEGESKLTLKKGLHDSQK